MEPVGFARKAILIFALLTPGKMPGALQGTSVTDQKRAGQRVLKLWAPMRDGVRLSTKVFLPEKDGKYPVVLQRTPYNKEGWGAGHEMWTQQGYAYVVQDTRGRFESEGTWYPFFQEKE